ncbi:MAG: 1-acyl-sn-glycerol-3-phosphate acyltransferase, partial [Alphaproteobacteria bacterium]|nr:1-acyl-sn-glycerol-3-phosphate acyltransferase [Alphaproteobacteria bacterium]
AMEPLVDAIKIEGKSICISPEGTRSLTPKLEPFKKGAFHLAMQAGVPIVPIVIHNATDVAPKNEFVMRPATVRVTVLPPVDTSGWTPRTINNHVRDVRNMFLRTLGQPEESVAASVAKEPAPDATPPEVKTEKAKPKKATAKKPAAKKKAPVPKVATKKASPRKGRAA